MPRVIQVRRPRQTARLRVNVHRAMKRVPTASATAIVRRLCRGRHVVPQAVPRVVGRRVAGPREMPLRVGRRIKSRATARAVLVRRKVALKKAVSRAKVRRDAAMCGATAIR